MRVWTLRGCAGIFLTLVVCQAASGQQQALTWAEVRARFEAANPNLRAGQLSVDESRAQEITAHLRPNPTLGLVADQINPFPGGPPHSTFGSLLTVGTLNYLYEREHKRDLRLESAQGTSAQRGRIRIVTYRQGPADGGRPS